MKGAKWMSYEDIMQLVGINDAGDENKKSNFKRDVHNFRRAKGDIQAFRVLIY